jgi:hypothetical protein
MLGTPAVHLDAEPAEPATENDAIVDCGLYLDGERQTGPMRYAEALATAREHANGFVWLGLRSRRRRSWPASRRPSGCTNWPSRTR